MGRLGGQGGLKSVAGGAHAIWISFHHNRNGINCDYCIAADGDGPYSVIDLRITDNYAVGLKFEVSDVPAAFSGNVVLRNNVSNQSAAAGILVLSGSNIDVSRNTFGGNLRYGLAVRQDRRGTVPSVHVGNNVMNGDHLGGCNLAGVTCLGNG